MSNPHAFRSRIEAILADVEEIVSGHANTRADDEQYEDPEEWWAVPLRDSLKRTLQELDDNL